MMDQEAKITDPAALVNRLNEKSATVSNRTIDSFLKDYTTLYNRLDAMYHTMEHLTRDLVTQISYIKKQMENFGG